MENKERELLELIRKHTHIIENPANDSLCVVVHINGTGNRIDLQRKYIEQQRAIQPVYGPRSSSIVPTEDTLEINKFKKLWKEVFGDDN